MNCKKLFALSIGALTFVGAPALFGQDESIQISIQTLAPEEVTPGEPAGIAPALLFAAFHNGQVDFIDYGLAPSTALAEFSGTESRGGLRAELGATDPDAVETSIFNIGVVQYRRNITTAAPPTANVALNPTKHQYFSFVGRIYPSDDAIFGNDDPKRYRIFDDQGNFLGPLVIEIYGQDVLDSGAWENDELGMPGSCEFGSGDKEPEAEVVRAHPGFHGSQRNTISGPANVLGEDICISTVGADTQWTVGETHGDFTRSGYPVARIRVTKGLGGNMSGSWYDPNRNGEGFFFEVVDNENPRLVVNWFTYRPDGSGEQVWLAGVGEIDSVFGSSAEIEMFITDGPQFGPGYDAEDFETTPWGSLIVEFSNCNQATVAYQSTIGGYGSGELDVTRISEPLIGAQGDCDWFLSPSRFFSEED